jgi:5-methylcytosine-specific restriction endonuclease McrA
MRGDSSNGRVLVGRMIARGYGSRGIPKGGRHQPRGGIRRRPRGGGMPNAPARPCLEPGCVALVGAGSPRCAIHSRDVRQSRTRRGYDEDWQRLRSWFMSIPDNQLCRSCLGRNVITLATDCDHVIPFRSLDDPNRLSPSNLQPLCATCHGRKTRGRGVRGR